MKYFIIFYLISVFLFQGFKQEKNDETISFPGVEKIQPGYYRFTGSGDTAD